MAKQKVGTYKERLDEMRNQILQDEREIFNSINRNNFYWDELTVNEKKFAKLGSMWVIESWLSMTRSERNEWFVRIQNKINARIEFYRTKNEPATESQPQQWISRAWAYEALGVPDWADKLEIQHAWKYLARQNHPDRGGDQERFNEIQKAYETIIFTA